MRSSTAQKITAKNEKRLFSKQNRSNFVSLRGAQRRGNLKAKGVASRGEAREHETRRNPYHRKTWIRCVSSLLLSLFQGSVSLRSTIVRYGMTNRIVKDCRVGRKKCALLAMTGSVGLIENTERKIHSSDSVKRFVFVA